MQNLLQLLALIPALIKTIKTLEAEIPLSGQGKAKLDAVVELVSTTDETVRGILPMIVSAITTLVNLFNKTGVFKSTAA